MKTYILALVISLTGLLHAQESVKAQPQPQPSDNFVRTAEVVSIHDGDTITVNVSCGFNTAAWHVDLRLEGVWASEVRGKEKAAGEADRLKLLSLIKPGDTVTVRTVKLASGEDTRTFARYVARVWKDGRDINAAMASSVTSNRKTK